MDLLAFHANLPFFDDQAGWKAATLTTLELDPESHSLLCEYLTSTGLDIALTPIARFPPRLLYLHIRALTSPTQSAPPGPRPAPPDPGTAGRRPAVHPSPVPSRTCRRYQPTRPYSGKIPLHAGMEPVSVELPNRSPTM